jgi:hypothetical protein
MSVRSRSSRLKYRSVRIPNGAYQTLRQLAAASGESVPEVLVTAVEEYRRARIWEQANTAWAAMRANPEQWIEECAERELWDRTATDELEVG